MKNIIDCACLQSYVRQILLLLILALIKNRMLPRQGSPATINHLSVGESGGYLPPLRWIIVKYSPIFKTARVAKKIWRIIKTIASILGRKYARIFVLEHFLFLVAHSFPRASLSENCSLLGTDNVRGQISEHIFAPNGDYCLSIRTIRTIRTIHYLGFPGHLLTLDNSRHFNAWTLSMLTRTSVPATRANLPATRPDRTIPCKWKLKLVCSQPNTVK